MLLFIVLTNIYFKLTDFKLCILRQRTRVWEAGLLIHWYAVTKNPFRSLWGSIRQVTMPLLQIIINPKLLFLWPYYILKMDTARRRKLKELKKFKKLKGDAVTIISDGAERRCILSLLKATPPGLDGCYWRCPGRNRGYWKSTPPGWRTFCLFWLQNFLYLF